MNIQRTLAVLIFVCAASFSTTVSADGEDSSKKNGTVFRGQQTFVCEEKPMRMPSHFAFANTMKEDLYLECDKDNSTVYLGLSSGCKGQNACGFGSYWSEEVSNGVAERIESVLIALARQVELENGMSAYYIPSKCHAYCNEAKLIWFDHSSVHIIGAEYTTGTEENIINELIESAVSLYKK